MLTTIEGIELEAILSTPRSLDKAEALAKQYGLSQATSDYELILSNPEVDTIYVGTPNHTHYDYAKKALLAGKHVICEKPFTLHLEEFEELAKLAQEKELLLMEAITNQYLANFTAIKEALSDIGDIKIVDINYSQCSSRYDAFKRGEIAPAFNPEMGGGALRDLNIYNIHLLVGLFGKPNRVEYLPNVERGVDTSGILVLDYGHFKAVAIGAKDCSAEIYKVIRALLQFLVQPILFLRLESLSMVRKRESSISIVHNIVCMMNLWLLKRWWLLRILTVLPSGWNIVVRLWKFWIKLRKLCNKLKNKQWYWPLLVLSYTVVGNEISINLSVCTVLSLSIKTISLSIFRLRKNSRITSNSLSLTARCLFEIKSS